jgi:hypothetical protein
MNDPHYTKLQMEHSACLVRMESKLDRVLELLTEHGKRLESLETWRDEQAKKEVRVKAWIAGAVTVITVAIEFLRWLLVR